MTKTTSKAEPVNMREVEYDVYIGRAGHGMDGYFGNPVRSGKECPICEDVHYAPGRTIPCFERYFKARVERDPTFRENVLALKGKKLGCFCKPKPCHGDVIAAWVNENA